MTSSSWIGSGPRGADFRFAHSAQGGRSSAKKCSPSASAPLPLETSAGLAVDQLLQRGYSLYPITRWPPKIIANARRPAAPRPTGRTLGPWPMPCAPTAMPGGLASQDQATAICACSVATKSPSSNTAPPWSTSSRPPWANTIPWPWKASRIGPNPSAGPSCERSPHPRLGPVQANANGKTSCTSTSSGGTETSARTIGAWATAPALSASPAVVNAKQVAGPEPGQRAGNPPAPNPGISPAQITQAFAEHPDHEFWLVARGQTNPGPAVAWPNWRAARRNIPDAQVLLCQAGVSPVELPERANPQSAHPRPLRPLPAPHHPSMGR